MKKSLNFWDILAWIALVGIVIWLLLKTFGIINTQVFLEYAPVYAAVYIAGWQIHKLSAVADDIKELKHFRNEIINQINEIKLNCTQNHSI